MENNEKEITAMNTKKVWTLTDIPPEKVAIKARWVFSNKDKNDKNYSTFKARLVTKGFTQKQEIIFFFENFASVTKYTIT